MPSIQPTVTHTYAYVVGIDTHAATHTYAVIEAATGAAIDTATFPTSAAGITRATTWIARRAHGLISATLTSMEGTGSYGSRLAAHLADHGYRVVEAPAARRPRGHGKTETIDALLAARGTNAMTLAELRDRRNGEQREALQILTTAREQLNHDLLAAINALTALLRRHDLGIDARKALSRRQVTAIAPGAAATKAWPIRSPARRQFAWPRGRSRCVKHCGRTPRCCRRSSRTRRRSCSSCRASDPSPPQPC